MSSTLMGKALAQLVQRVATKGGQLTLPAGASLARVTAVKRRTSAVAVQALCWAVGPRLFRVTAKRVEMRFLPALLRMMQVLWVQW